MRFSMLLSSHVRRARSFQSAVHCFASSLAAPFRAYHNPSHMDADEEAGTTASLDHIIARLQTLEAEDQVHNVSDLIVVVNLRSEGVHRVVGDPSNSTDRQTRCGFHHGGLKPHVRFATHVSFWWNAEFDFAGRPTRGPSLVPDVGSVTGAVCTPLQPHSWPQTRKKVGRVGRHVVQQLCYANFKRSLHQKKKYSVFF